MRIVVIDGQGGRVGRELISAIKGAGIEAEIIAVGTNSTATACMMEARPTAGASGENAVAVNARRADVIVAPLGAVMADAMHGEITEAMASAIARSGAAKLLLPVSKCGVSVVGAKSAPISELIAMTPDAIKELVL